VSDSQEFKATDCEADHAPLSNGEVTNEWSYASTPYKTSWRL